MMYMLWRQTVRNLKIYFKDKANVFFSLLASLIVLGLYLLFLKDTQVDALLSALEAQGAEGGKDTVRAFADAWMLSGVLSCACITVPLCVSGVIVQDKRRGICDDLRASPVPEWLPPAAYFCSVVLAGVLLALVVLAVCLVWLAAAGSWFLTAADVFALLGNVLLSVLSSSMLLVFVVGFLRSEGAFTGLNVILGTVIGFLIGAYMPLSMFPQGVRYFTLFVPGSYSAGIFRHFFLRGALEELSSLSAPFADALAEQYATELDFFGTTLGAGAMALVLAGTAVLFAAANLAAAAVRTARR